MNEYSLTEGSVLKKLLRFALPILGANILQSLYGTVDLMIVGLFTGASEVSAVSTGSMTMQTITGIVIGLTMGTTVLLGNSIGSRDYAKASRTVASSAVLFAGVGIGLTFLITVLAAPVSVLMNAPQEAFAQTVSYIRICGFGAICIVLFNVLSGIFRGLGDSRTPLVLMAVSCVCNIAGDLLLVGKMGLGSAGAAIATVAAQGISVVSACFIIKRKSLGFPMKKEELHPAKMETRLILKYGLPIAAQDLLTGASFMVILSILNGFGLIASAGVGVAEKICGLMFIVPGAMMSAVSAFSAQNVGAGRFDRAKQGMYFGMAITFAAGLCMFLLGFTRGTWLAGFFAKDLQICLAAADYLRSYSVDCVIVGFNFCMMGYLNGHGKTGFVALQGILSTFLVRIPVSYVMSRIPGVSLFQIGFATPLATLFAIVLSVIYLISFEKKRPAR
ncbi:MAG: MATE family efflux transporter [Firmicutes bacterium]|nr:MATE family efflux transporter [Bacillota bacterium]